MTDQDDSSLYWLQHECPQRLRLALLDSLSEATRQRVFAGLRGLSQPSTEALTRCRQEVMKKLFGKVVPAEILEIGILRSPRQAARRLFAAPCTREEVAVLLMSLPSEVTGLIFKHLSPRAAEEVTHAIEDLPQLSLASGQNLTRRLMKALSIPLEDSQQILERALREAPDFVEQVLRQLHWYTDQLARHRLSNAQIQAIFMQQLPEPLLRFWMDQLDLDELCQLALASRHTRLNPRQQEQFQSKIWELMGYPDMTPCRELHTLARRHPERVADWLMEQLELGPDD